MQPTAAGVRNREPLRLMPNVRQPNRRSSLNLGLPNFNENRNKGMRWTQESLVNARGVLTVVVGVLVLLAYLISKL